MSSFLLERLRIAHPILQAPMAGVSTPALASAVSDAGALGALGIGASGVEDARNMIERTRALTGAPFNVNVFCHQPARRDAAREAAWLAWLAPLFAEFGAEPPATLAVFLWISRRANGLWPVLAGRVHNPLSRP